MCEVRGEVVFVGLSKGPIPWPIGKRGRVQAIAVFGALAEAVRREPLEAVCHWFGVGQDTVWRWRRALGVPAVNEGSRLLKSEAAQDPDAIQARAEGVRRVASDPERVRKIAESRRGKPRPAHVIEAVRAAHRGKPESEETRRKMREAHRRRGTRPPKAGVPWTEPEDELVRTLPASEAAHRTGRTLGAVHSRRLILGLPDGRVRR